MTTQILQTLDAGNDVLIVRGTVDGQPVEACGWLSAMTQHFDDHDYEDIPEATEDDVHGKAHGRHRKADAVPREMTADEKRAYCTRLLETAAGVATPISLD
jgi:hypothetical protein